MFPTAGLPHPVQPPTGGRLRSQRSAPRPFQRPVEYMTSRPDMPAQYIDLFDGWVKLSLVSALYDHDHLSPPHGLFVPPGVSTDYGAELIRKAVEYDLVLFQRGAIYGIVNIGFVSLVERGLFLPALVASNYSADHGCCLLTISIWASS